PFDLAHPWQMDWRERRSVPGPGRGGAAAGGARCRVRFAPFLPRYSKLVLPAPLARISFHASPGFSMPNDPQIEALKTPPHSMEGEQSVLGGLLIDNTAIDRIADVVSEADFYNDGHRLVFRAINELVMNNKPADVVTVAERLESLAKL